MISALIETTKPSISRAQVERIPGLMVPKGARMRGERRELGKQGWVWRLPVFMLALLLLFNDLGPLPFVIGILYILAIFEFGWYGGGDPQLAFGLAALGRDWWILAYLFGGTILLGFAVMFRRHGFGGGLERSRWVLGNWNSPDEEAIKLPWAVLASTGGLAYMWVFPGLM
jgi:hypothetical protein